MSLAQSKTPYIHVSLDGITAGVTTVLAGYLVVWLDNNEIMQD